MYRYLHDQTLHLANRGLTPDEIAEEMKLPARWHRSSTAVATTVR